ncbi:MAG: hypothetical protein NW226_16590 [Microscillaceae bacterium]|nr:hypothetical protein [Microscillaceae bacterium]
MFDVIRLIFRPEVLVFLIPITAIIGGFYITALKIKVRQNPSISDDEKRVIATVIHENQEIKERLSNLESIITSMDKEILMLKSADDAQINQQRVKELSEKMKPSNS